VYFIKPEGVDFMKKELVNIYGVSDIVGMFIPYKKIKVAERSKLFPMRQHVNGVPYWEKKEVEKFSKQYQDFRDPHWSLKDTKNDEFLDSVINTIIFGK